MADSPILTRPRMFRGLMSFGTLRRKRVLQSLIPFFALACSLQAASVSGTVYLREGPSRQPLSGVRVIARSPDGKEVLRVAETDGQGHYTLAELAGTNLIVSVTKTGFVVGGRSLVALNLSRAVTPQDFDMFPGGVVTGRITDLQGEPLGGIPIELLHAGATAAERGSTDDRGVYRVFGLEPGRYTMLARQDGQDTLPVFYPGRNKPGSAQPFDVAAGSEVEGIDLRLLRGPMSRVASVAGFLPLPSPPAASTPAAVGPKTPGQGSISGTVTSAQTGLPLQSASVRISAMVNGRLVMLTATSGPGGKYSLQGLDPGSYTVSAEKSGYEMGRLPRPLVLTEKQDRTGVDLSLNIIPVISGRVRDGEGRPVIGAIVTAYRWRFRNEQRIAAKASSTTTDDRGQYRLTSLAPGRYMVGASRPVPPGPKGDLNMDEGRTFYPSTPRASQAIVLELRFGQEATQINLDMLPQETFSVSGVVTDAETGGPCTSCTIRAISMEESNSFSQAEAGVASDGTYRVRGLPPGSYRIVAEKTAGGRRLRSAQNTVISNRDIADVSLLGGVSLTVTGRVVYESAPPALTSPPAGSGPTLPPVTVSLTTVDAIEEDGEVRSDGTFEIHGLSTDRYLVGAEYLPEGSYLRAVRISGQEVPTPELDLTRGGLLGPMELVVSYKAAQLAGQVKGPEVRGDAIPAPISGLVLLFSQGTQLLPVVRVSTYPDGRFSLNGAPPGAYTAFAVSLDSKTDWEDPDVRRQYQSFGRGVVLVEGKQTVLELPLVPGE